MGTAGNVSQAGAYGLGPSDCSRARAIACSCGSHSHLRFPDAPHCDKAVPAVSERKRERASHAPNACVSSVVSQEDHTLATLLDLALVLVYTSVLLIQACDSSEEVCKAFGLGETAEGAPAASTCCCAGFAQPPRQPVGSFCCRCLPVLLLICPHDAPFVTAVWIVATLE